MRSQIYLILIRDGSLALTVGAGLENRLLRDGCSAMALVPAVRGPEFADSDYHRNLAMWRSSSASVDHAPQVVALYEDGLLAGLESLGLPAYVGVQHGEEPRIARWADDSGAIMLPVATARDLVDAVADHTPWSRYAADLPSARYPLGAKVMPMARRSRQSSHDGPPARSRKVVAVASVAVGPLLLAGLPSAAIAVGGMSPAPALAAKTSGATGFALTADTQPAPPAAPAPAPPAPAPPANTGTSNTWSNFFTNLGTGIQNYANATVTGAGNLLNQAGTSFNNAMILSGQAQINEAQAYQALANSLAQNNAAADQAGNAWGTWAARPGAAIGGATLAGIAMATTSETGPGALLAGVTAYPYGSKLGGTAGLGLGYLYGYLNYQLSHLGDSAPGSTTTSTPGSSTGGSNPFINALAAGDQLGQTWTGSLTGADKLAGEGLGYGAYNLLGNVQSSQGSPANPSAGNNQLELFPPGTPLGQAPAGSPAAGPNWGQQTVGNVKNFTGIWGNGAATLTGLEYTGGFLTGFFKNLFAATADAQPGSNVVVGPDGSVTVTAPDGTVTTTGADGTVTVTAPSSTASGGTAPGAADTATAAPGGAAPSGAASSGAAPGSTASGGAAPSDAASGGAAPSDAASGGAAPSDAASGGAAPSDAASGGAAPSDAASGGAAPSDAASGGAAPGSAASGDAASGGAASGGAAPGGAAPGAAADAAPGDAAPVAAAPAAPPPPAPVSAVPAGSSVGGNTAVAGTAPAAIPPVTTTSVAPTTTTVAPVTTTSVAPITTTVAPITTTSVAPATGGAPPASMGGNTSAMVASAGAPAGGMSGGGALSG